MVDKNKDPDIYNSMVRFYIKLVNEALEDKGDVASILQDIPSEALYSVVDTTDTWDYLSVERSRELGMINTEYANDRVEPSSAISPAHYKEIIPGYEYMDMMVFMLKDKSGVESHLLGQIYKYLMRCGKKDAELQELKKAQWYLNYLVTHLEKH